MRLWLACLIGVVGCSPEQTLWVPPPNVETDARSVVLVFADEARAEFAVAAPLVLGDLDRPLTLKNTPWNHAVPDHPQIRAFFYPDTLAELELPEGRLEGTDPRSCRLEAPIALQRIAAGEDNSWAAAEITLFESEHAVVLGDQPCKRPNLCRHLSHHSLVVPIPQEVNGIVPLDDRSALLVFGYVRAAYRVTQDAVVTSTIHAPFPGYANFLTADGELWLGGIGGIVVHGPVSGPFVTSTIPNIDDFSVAAIDVDPDTGEALALSVYDPRTFDPTPPMPNAMLAVHRLRAGNWIELHRSEVTTAKVSAGRIVRWGEGRSVAVYRDYTYLLIDGDHVEKVSPANWGLLDPYLNSVANFHGALYFGATNGQLYRDATGTGDLMSVPSAALSTGIEALFPWGDGMFLGGAEGFFGEYNPLSTPCDLIIRAQTDIEVIARVGDSLLLGGGNLDFTGQPNTVTWVTVEP